MIVDEKGKPIDTRAPMLRKAMDGEVQKGDLQWAFGEGSLTVNKTGEQVKQAVSRKLFEYQEQMLRLRESLAAAKAEVVASGLPEPQEPTFDSKGGYPFADENCNWDTMNSTQKRASNKYHDIVYQMRGVNDDIKTASAISSMVEDKKTYPISLKQALLLFQ